MLQIAINILAVIGGLTCMGALWLGWLVFVSTRGCVPYKTSHELNDGDN